MGLFSLEFARKLSDNLKTMTARVMILGVGAFAHAVMSILKENGAETSCYLTRQYSHFGPKTTGHTWKSEEYPTPLPLIETLSKFFL